MRITKYKPSVDILAMILTLAAIITGFMLHNDVWHRHVYDNTSLWNQHEAAGLALLILVAVHCTQHSFWFKNYSKIKSVKKIVTTILLIVALTVAVSGIMLMCGSRSEVASHIHYIGAIIFTILAIGHIAKRWKIFKSLLLKS